jgi:hypothetical protein
MSVSISVWLKDILPRTPGIMRSVAKRELVLAAREFYRDSTAWRAYVESVYWDSGDFAYTVPSPDTAAEVMQVLGIEVNGSDLNMKAERPKGDRGSGTPTVWYPTGPDTLEIWPTPDMYDDTVLARVVLIPTVDAVTLPDVAQTRHYEGILDGVLGRLYAHPAKPYSNPTLGQYHLNRFRNFIGVAAGEVKQGGAAGQNWAYPRFGK